MLKILNPITALISFCTVQLRTLCATHSLATLCLSTTSGPGSGELPGFWGSMVFRHALIPRKGSGNINNSNIISGVCKKFLSEGTKFRHNRVTSQSSFAFAKTAWFYFTFLYF